MQAGTLIADKYRVERVIGRGGMGIVVEATHLALQTKVALKFLDAEMLSEPTAVARFSREARALATLKGDHICRVLDFGINAHAPFIVMELLVGTDLARLSKARVLDVSTASVFIKQACMGLAEPHAAGIIHRDLKPGNLFLTRRADGSPLIKILDFGVATAPAGSDEVGLTGTSNVVGSPGYMSPEQFRSSRTVDARTDVWSLGVILYKLVSGTLPFSGDGFAEFALSITRDPVPPLPNVHPKFQAIVTGCLEKDLDKRFPNVTVVSEALTLFASQARSSALVFPIREQTPDPDGERPIAPPTEVQRAPAAKATILGTIEASALVAPPVPAPSRPDPRPTVEGTAYGSDYVTIPQVQGELAPGTVVGEYRIDRKIGEGGMGVVYAAVHPLIGKKAAIKVIAADLGADPVVVQRFVDEARSVNQIGHPNIVDVFAFGKLPDGRNYFVMEHLQGESLRARVTRMFIPLGDAIQILDEIAGALEAAHEMKIVHRDLKPDNVFLSQVRGNMIIVKLLDFGIAKLAGEGTGMAKTHTGEMIGTPAYLSPEQARGKGVDHRTDIYALGCMMFEMVTGRLPFMGESPMDIVLMHLTTPQGHAIEIRKDLPPQLDQLIFCMMDKDPDRRPSLAEVRDLFAELVVSGAIPIEHGTGATFRSELARGPKTPLSLSNKGPGLTGLGPATHLGQPAAPVVPAITPMPTARRRPANPSDAPTQIAFTPAADHEIELSAAPPPPRSRKALVVGIVGAGFLVPILTIAIALGTKKAAQTAGTPPGDAAPAPIAAVVTPVDAGAAIAPVTPDAAVATVATRDVQIKVNVPTARIEIDGAVVPSQRGVATLSLADGTHDLVVTAAGRVAHKQPFEVSSSTKLEIRLARVPRLKPTPPKDPPPAKPTVPKKPDDAPIDPFAP